jgi:hypothetical protein
MDDIVFIKGELQAIRGHMEIYKKNHMDFNKIQVEQTSILRDISTAIKGNEMTNNKGMIHDFEEMQEELKRQHDNQVKYGVYFKLMGLFLMLLTGSLIGAFVKIYTNTNG